jgi:hypothetical protein
VVNSGKRALTFDTIYIRNTTGVTTTLSVPSTTLKVGDIATLANASFDSCDGIKNAIEFVTVNTINCPSTAYDNLEGSMVVYTNC